MINGIEYLPINTEICWRQYVFIYTSTYNHESIFEICFSTIRDLVGTYKPSPNIAENDNAMMKCSASRSRCCINNWLEHQQVRTALILPQSLTSSSNMSFHHSPQLSLLQIIIQIQKKICKVASALSFHNPPQSSPFDILRRVTKLEMITPTNLNIQWSVGNEEISYKILIL